MAYQIIPDLRYLGYQAYYKISDEKEPATTPIATASAVSDSGDLQSVDAYPVYEAINSNSNSNRYNRSSYGTEIPGTIKYSDGNHLVEVPTLSKNRFFQENPTKIIYRRYNGLTDRFVPIGHFVSVQLVRGKKEYKFSAINDAVTANGYTTLYYDPRSSGGNKRKSYRRRLVSAKRKSRKSRK